MQKLLMVLLVSALAILLAACGTTGTGGIETSPCVAQRSGEEPAWRAIGWSKRDTLETVDEAKANNARRNAWCGVK